MILDRRWKNDLKVIKIKLEIISKLKIKSSLIEHLVKKYYLYSAAIIRKTYEYQKENEPTKKIDNFLYLIDYKVKVLSYDYIGDGDYVCYNLDKSDYDFSNSISCDIAVNCVCNQIIHSVVFSVIYDFDKNTICGISVSSSNFKYKKMYLIKIEEYINLIDHAIENLPK